MFTQQTHTPDSPSVGITSDFSWAYMYFWLVVAGYVVFQLGMQPQWLLGGEMFAEMATNYYANAGSASWIQRVFALDAGYIPLPPRLIALIPALLGTSAAIIPYLYTWSGTVLDGLLTGCFCLPLFRKVITSDALRCLFCIAALLVVDFQTRTFINFSYFAVFPAVYLTLLAWADGSSVMPRWGWFLPLFLLSKPACLLVLPGLATVAWIKNGSFRWMALVSIVIGLIQINQLRLSFLQGILQSPETHTFTLLDKLIASCQHSLGFLAGYTVGPAGFKHIHHALGLNGVVVTGAIFLGISIIAICKIKNSSALLIGAGLALIILTLSLNCFALSGEWNLSLSHLSHLSFDRRTIVAFWGVLLMVAGACVGLGNPLNSALRFRQKHGSGIISCLLFTVWFILSGWLNFGLAISHKKQSPDSDNSYWQAMASTIDAKQAHTCVPIDPFGWVYGYECGLLNKENIPFRPVIYRHVLPVEQSYNIPVSVQSKKLVSLALLVRPLYRQDNIITSKAIITDKNNRQFIFAGRRLLKQKGGLLLLTGSHHSAVETTQSITIQFNQPVAIAMLKDSKSALLPAIMWMGY